MKKSKVENGEVIELINGVINTYFVRTVLDRPDMAKNAKDDLFEIVINALNQRELEVARKISNAAQEAGLVPNELTSGKDWKKALGVALNQQRETIIKEVFDAWLSRENEASFDYWLAKKMYKLKKFLTKLEEKE